VKASGSFDVKVFLKRMALVAILGIGASAVVAILVRFSGEHDIGRNLMRIVVGLIMLGALWAARGASRR
jgi:hypothetical protein